MRTASGVPMPWSASGTSSTSHPASASSRATAASAELVDQPSDEELAAGVGSDRLGDLRVDEQRGEPDGVEPAFGGVRRGAGAERLPDDHHVVGRLLHERGLDVTAYPLLGILLAP